MKKARIIIGVLFLIAGGVGIYMFAVPSGEESEPVYLVAGIALFFLGTFIAGGKKAVLFLKKIVDLAGGTSPRPKL